MGACAEIHRIVAVSRDGWRGVSDGDSDGDSDGGSMAFVDSVA